MGVIRSFRHKRQPRTAFVLGGGGNLGAIQVGMLKALTEAGIVPDLLIGCSVGALNAAAVADDPSPDGVRRLERLWCDIRADDVFPTGRLHGAWQLAMRGEAICGNEGLRSLIERWLSYRTFDEAHVPLHVVATSLRSGVERWFSSGPVVEPLLASAALPAILPPVHIDGEPFIDGGVVDNVPISRAVELGAGRVFVLHVGNFERRRRTHARRPLDVLIEAFSIARTHRYRVEREEQRDGVEVICLPGIDPGPLRYNDFTRSAQLMERAYATTQTSLVAPRSDEAATR